MKLAIMTAQGEVRHYKDLAVAIETKVQEARSSKVQDALAAVEEFDEGMDALIEDLEAGIAAMMEEHEARSHVL
ncbi:hypothetical protein KCU98_g1676, partial [Aureobasidium melanogenum]